MACSSDAPGASRPNTCSAANAPVILVHPALALRPERACRRRHVDVVLMRDTADRRQHADNRVHPVVHLHDLSDDVRVAGELLLPVRVAQHQHRLGAQVIVRVDERPAVQRLHAQHIEEVGGDDAGVDAIGLALVEERERHRVVLDQVANGLQALR